MRCFKLLLPFVAMLLFVEACNKNHYDVSNVKGVNAEGEVLTPLVSNSLSIMELLERLASDSILQCSEEGDLFFGYHFEFDNVLSGNELLSVHDMDYDAHYAFLNPFPNAFPINVDTVLSFTNALQFETDHVRVVEAAIKSGRFDFTVSSNIGDVQRVTVMSPDISDAYGNMFRYEAEVQNNTFGFDISQLNYTADSANKLSFAYEFYFSLTDNPSQELFVDVHIKCRDLEFAELRGFVESFGKRNRIDTLYNILSDNMLGSAELNKFRLRFRGSNSFGTAARLVIDTALYITEEQESFPLINQVPIVVSLPSQPNYSEILDQMLSGKINSCGGRILESSEIIINPEGTDEITTVNSNSAIDLGVDIELPLSFRLDDVIYMDTIEMNLSDVEFPDMIEKLSLDFTFNSTLPINLEAGLYLYDSIAQHSSENLVSEGNMILGSFDNHPVISTVRVEVSGELLHELLSSDYLILLYEIDTGTHEVVLEPSQSLELNVKAKIKYNGCVEFSN